MGAAPTAFAGMNLTSVESLFVRVCTDADVDGWSVTRRCRRRRRGVQLDDKTGAGAAEPEDGCGESSLWPRAYRCCGGSLGPVELALGGHVCDHRGLDGAGADSVDADPAGRVLHGGAGG